MAHRSRSLELLVFTVGAGSLGAEIAAARLLAPWFGASTIVWANTIAVVLVALSIGYALGGRFADRAPYPAGLARIVLVAAALLAVVPFVSGPFLHQAVRAVDQLSAATFVGSLLGVGALIAVPLVAAGTAVVQHLASYTAIGDDDPDEALDEDLAEDGTPPHPVPEDDSPLAGPDAPDDDTDDDTTPTKDPR